MSGRYYIMHSGSEYELFHLYGGAYYLHTDNEQGVGGWCRVDPPPIHLLKQVDNIALF